MDSVVFLDSGNTAFEISADLRIAMDDNDRILVSKMVSGNHQGWLARDVWEWINARL